MFRVIGLLTLIFCTHHAYLALNSVKFHGYLRQR